MSVGRKISRRGQ